MPDSLRDQAHAELDRILEAERQSSEKGQASADISKDGITASVSGEIKTHLTWGAYFRQKWNGVKEYGAKLKASW